MAARLLCSKCEEMAAGLLCSKCEEIVDKQDLTGTVSVREYVGRTMKYNCGDRWERFSPKCILTTNLTN